MSSSKGYSICPRGLVVGGKSLGRTRRLAKIDMPREQTRRLTLCRVNICKMREYGPYEVTGIPLRCFAQ
jgi:hypothetical protein